MFRRLKMGSGWKLLKEKTHSRKVVFGNGDFEMEIVELVPDRCDCDLIWSNTLKNFVILKKTPHIRLRFKSFFRKGVVCHVKERYDILFSDAVKKGILEEKEISNIVLQVQWTLKKIKSVDPHWTHGDLHCSNICLLKHSLRERRFGPFSIKTQWFPLIDNFYFSGLVEDKEHDRKMLFRSLEIIKKEKECVNTEEVLT